jgi:hypothetical protein
MVVCNAGAAVTRSTIRLRSLPWLLAVLAPVLASCSSEWTNRQERMMQANTTPPISYKADIIAFMRTYLNDPTGVRGAFVSQPDLREIDGLKRYTVCLRYTPRKSSGGYQPAKESIVLFRDGRLDRMIDNARDQCKDAAYQPFPELEHLSR